MFTEMHIASTTPSHIYVTLTLLTLFASHALGYSATVVIGEVARRDTSRPTYEVHFPPLGEYNSPGSPAVDDVPPGVTSMRMVTARGQAMRCFVPAPVPVSHSDSLSNHSEQTIYDDIDDLLSQYKDKCYVRHEGWWTYEFCFGKHVVQKHIIPKDRNPNKGEVEDVFVLGTYDRDADLTRRKNATDISTSDAPFTQIFLNGTVCDMTNKKRRVLVKYMCRDEAVQLGGASKKSAQMNLNLLNAVREVESCVYEVEFINGAICNHASYKEKLARAARPIHCSLETGEAPFEGLLSTTYKKASLNL